jgi:hypothetical protein
MVIAPADEKGRGRRVSRPIMRVHPVEAREPESRLLSEAGIAERWY